MISIKGMLKYSILVGFTIIICMSCEKNDTVNTVDELQGLWTGYEVGTVTTWEMNFESGKFSYVVGGEEVYSGTYSSDTTNSIRKITGVVTSSNNNDYVGKQVYAIYQFIEDDVIVLAGNEPGVEEFPKKFSTLSDSRIFKLSRNGKEIPREDDIIIYEPSDINFPDTQHDTIPDVITIDGKWKGLEKNSNVEWSMEFDYGEFGYAMGGDEVYSGTYVLNRAATPKTMIATITQSNDAQYVGKKSYAIYKLISADSLVIAIHEPGESTYPENFDLGSFARIFEMGRQ